MEEEFESVSEEIEGVGGHDVGRTKRFFSFVFSFVFSLVLSFVFSSAFYFCLLSFGGRGEGEGEDPLRQGTLGCRGRLPVGNRTKLYCKSGPPMSRHRLRHCRGPSGLYM